MGGRSTGPWQPPCAQRGRGESEAPFAVDARAMGARSSISMSCLQLQEPAPSDDLTCRARPAPPPRASRPRQGLCREGVTRQTRPGTRFISPLPACSSNPTEMPRRVPCPVRGGCSSEGFCRRLSCCSRDLWPPATPCRLATKRNLHREDI
jgi:hypothetical protein